MASNSQINGPRPNEEAEEIGEDHEDSESSCGEEGALEPANDDPFPGTSIELIKLESNVDPNWSSPKGLKMETEEVKSESDEELSGNEEAEDDSEVPGGSDDGAYHLAEVSYGEEDDEVHQKSTGMEGNSESLDRDIAEHKSKLTKKTLKEKMVDIAFKVIVRKVSVQGKEDGKVTRRKRYKCSICHYENFERYRVVEHSKTHMDLKPFRCQDCGKVYKYASSLRIHREIQHEPSLHNCPQCGLRCGREHILRRHMRLHSDERPFACPLCSYSAKQAGSLRSHMQTHSDDKPFECGVCGYACKHYSLIRKHILLYHNLTYRFVCSVCDRRLVSQGVLDKHFREHFVDRKFSCDVCGKRYATNDSLRSHKRNVHPTKEQRCRICSIKLDTIKQMKRHVSKHLKD